MGSGIRWGKILLATIIGVIVASGLLMASTLRRGLEGRILVAGVSPDLPPLEYREDGVLRGISVDLLDYAARRSGYSRVRYLVMPYDQLLDAVANGTVDVAAGIIFSEDSASRALLTQPYYNVTLWVIPVGRCQAPSRLEELGGLRVGVMENDTIALSVLSSLRSRYGYRIIIVAGHWDKAVASSPRLTLLPHIVVSSSPPESAGYASSIYMRYSFAVSRNNPELLSKLASSINQAVEEGEMRRITKKYLGPGG